MTPPLSTVTTCQVAGANPQFAGHVASLRFCAGPSQYATTGLPRAFTCSEGRYGKEPEAWMVETTAAAGSAAATARKARQVRAARRRIRCIHNSLDLFGFFWSGLAVAGPH